MNITFGFGFATRPRIIYCRLCFDDLFVFRWTLKPTLHEPVSGARNWLQKLVTVSGASFHPLVGCHHWDIIWRQYCCCYYHYCYYYNYNYYYYKNNNYYYYYYYYY